MGTKFWHELTEQQQHFVSLLASGEDENIQLAKQLFISVMPENHRKQYTRLIEQPQGSRGQRIAEKLLRKKQIEFIVNCNLPNLSCHSISDYKDIFGSVSFNLGLKDWRGFSWDNIFFICVIYDTEPQDNDPINEIKKIISYPFGYKDNLLCRMGVTQNDITLTQERIKQILVIAPNTTFFLTNINDTWHPYYHFLEHKKAVLILEPIIQQKNWLISARNVRHMLLHGQKPNPNPFYLKLQNTCFYIANRNGCTTNPEQWLDILAASPEWKERNLTYKFID